MDDDIINKDFDDFLKKRYEDHTIKPDRALWEGINARLYQKKTDTNFHKVRQLIVAFASLAIVLVATFICFEIKTQKYKTEVPLISETIETPASLNNINNNLLPLKQYSKPQEIISDTIKETSGLNRNFSLNNVPISEVRAVDSKMNLDSAFSFSPPSVDLDSLNNHVLPLLTTRIKDSSITRNKNVEVPEKTEILKDMEQVSLKFSEPITSILTFIVKPVIDKSVKSGQGDLKLSGLNQSLTQSGESGTSRSVKRFPFFIEGFMSPEISYRALVANTQYSVQDYGKTYFNKKEKADFTFSTGVSGGFSITDNIILRSGFFYSRYSLKFKTEAIHLLNTSSDGNLVYTSSGPVNLKLMSSDSLSNESLIKSSLNFSYLNIPLVAELHFKNNYYINLGLNFNMLVGQNMNWQAEDYDGNFSNATADPIDGLKTSSISMILGFGVEKHVSHNLSIIVNPSLKVHLSSINSTAPVKSYPYAWGLNAGFRYYFN